MVCGLCCFPYGLEQRWSAPQHPLCACFMCPENSNQLLFGVCMSTFLLFSVTLCRCVKFRLLKTCADAGMMSLSFIFLLIPFYARQKNGHVCDGKSSTHQAETALRARVGCIYPAVLGDTNAHWHVHLHLCRTDTPDSLGLCEMGLMRRRSVLFL